MIETGDLMLRRAMPITLTALLLASCGSGGETPALPVAETPDGGAPDVITVGFPDDLTVSVSEPDKSQPASPHPKSDGRTMATISEHMPWSVRLNASSGSGASFLPALTDNGNGDASAFEFDEETFQFTLTTPQDYERPTDANRDNRFELILTLPEYPSYGGLPFTIDIGDQAEIFETGDTVLILGATPYGGLGRNALSPGDIDADGRPDLILAAPGQHSRDLGDDFPPEESNRGEAFLLSGKALSEIETHALQDNLPAGILKLDGVAGDLHLGYSMTTIGDLDEDGVNDFAIARSDKEIALLSGQNLTRQMRSGGSLELDDLPIGTLSLGDNFYIDPHALAALGDLNLDGLPDLGVCVRRGALTQNNTMKLVTAISGAGLAGIMSGQTNTSLDDLISVDQAGYYGRSSQTPRCGRLVSLGDVDADGIGDVAIPTSEYGGTGAWVFSGYQLRDWMISGTTHQNPNPFWVAYPYTHFDDPDVTGVSQDRVVVPLGDVTGDDIDDFALSWQTYQRADHSAFIINGAPNVLTNPSRFANTKSVRTLVSNGEAIELRGPGGSAQIRSVFPILAPEGGLHDTLSLVRIGLNQVFSFVASDLPTGGTQALTLPVGAAGSLTVPQGYRNNFSEMISIGDLNQDGYGDLAIGYALADPRNESSRPVDGGAVWLVSGKALFEMRDRGEVFDPQRAHPLP
jgi:hypothetical protein